MTAEAEAETPKAPAVQKAAPGTAAKVHIALSALFLLAGLTVAAINVLQLLWPGLTEGVGFLGFGRLRPIAFNLLALGFGGLGLIGAAYWALPRLVGRPLAGEMLAVANAILGSAGVAAGAVFVGLGQNQGAPYFELPLWADAAVFVSFAASALLITATARASRVTDAPAVWFFVAGSWWLALAYLAGNVPGFSGVNAALQNAFAFHALAVLGLVGLALGAAYLVAGDGFDRGQRGTRVSRVGFWSFAFIGGWLGPRLLVFGPIPDWLETIAIVFALVFVVPVWAILSDLAPVLGSRRVDATTRRFLLAGGSFFALIPLQNLVQATRSPSSIVQFTSWGSAFELLVIIGVAGSWLLAFVYHAVPDGGWNWARRGHWWGTIIGLGAALAGMYAAGLHQGLVWVGGARSGEQVASGEGFINVVEPLDGWLAITAVGLVILAISQLAFADRAGRLFSMDAPPLLVEAPAAEEQSEAESELNDEDEVGERPWEPADPVAIGALARGAAGLFVFAAIAVFLIPSLEASHSQASIRGLERDFDEGSLEAEGRQLYISEGCMYCHTQQVRPIVTDVQLGPVSVPGDYVAQSPALMGYWRLGPDLFVAGSRDVTDSVRWNIDHLRSPRRTFDDVTSRGWSTMPSYDHLSDEELLQLASYIVALN